jgi:anti-anti-sigma factor
MICARFQDSLALDTLGRFGDIVLMSVQIHTSKEENGTVVQLQGKVDATSAPSVEQTLVGVIDQGEKRLVLDCAGMDFISSAGLRSLLLAVKKMKAAGGGISLAALQPNVKEVFDISGFSALFTIHGSRADALK